MAEGYLQFKTDQGLVIALLASGRALYSDEQERMFVPSTGFPHVCRLDMSKLDKDYVSPLVTTYCAYLRDELKLDSFFGKRAFSSIISDTPRAFGFAKAVRDALAAEGIEKRLVQVPEQLDDVRGKGIVVVDAVRTGYTVANTVRALRKRGARIDHICSLFDYEYGSALTLQEAMPIDTPKLHAFLSRSDTAFYNREHIVAGGFERKTLKLIWHYQTGPVRYAVNHLHTGFVVEKKKPQAIIVNTEHPESPDTAREAMERAILRMSIESALYPSEQWTWTPAEKKALQEDAVVKMAAVRNEFITRYAQDASRLHWMEALGPLIKEAKIDAQIRGCALNGRDPEHARNVRQFVKVLLEHQPRLPYNICGMMNMHPLSVSRIV